MLNSNISKSSLDDKYLRLENKSVKKHVIIPPKYLGNLKKGIENEILTSSQEIIDEFDGVPISIGKISLLQNVATSIDDHAYLSFYVNLDCVVFKPKIGKKVLAVVQKIAPTYIGCLICERINATIFKKDRKSSEQQNNKELDNIQIGQKILIKIQSIQNRHNTMFIISTFEKILE